MAMETGIFPTTTASFEKIREDVMHYVDKTDLVWQLANRCEVVFLSRPRRFGKSMFLDTVGCYLEGQKELFEGLRIAELEEGKGEKAWVKHPVLRFDFSALAGPTEKSMNRMLQTRVKETCRQVGLPVPSISSPDDIYDVITELRHQTGARVGVLIDEYDSPLLDMLASGDAAGLEAVKGSAASPRGRSVSSWPGRWPAWPRPRA